MSRNSKPGRRSLTAASASSLLPAGPGAVALIVEDAGHEIADVRFVVDDEDVLRHDLSLTCRFVVLGRQFAEAGERALILRVVGRLGLGYGSSDRRVAANRSRIQAPRPPWAASGASNSSILPPCSSRILPTMARPRPVPFSRVVT